MIYNSSPLQKYNLIEVPEEQSESKDDEQYSSNNSKLIRNKGFNKNMVKDK